MRIVAPAVAGLLFISFGEKRRYQGSRKILTRLLTAICSRTTVKSNITSDHAYHSSNYEDIRPGVLLIPAWFVDHR